MVVGKQVLWIYIKMLASCPSFRELTVFKGTLVILLHEIAHNLRYEKCGERNEFLQLICNIIYGVAIYKRFLFLLPVAIPFLRLMTLFLSHLGLRSSPDNVIII